MFNLQNVIAQQDIPLAIELKKRKKTKTNSTLRIIIIIILQLIFVFLHILWEIEVFNYMHLHTINANVTHLEIVICSVIANSLTNCYVHSKDKVNAVRSVHIEKREGGERAFDSHRYGSFCPFEKIQFFFFFIFTISLSFLPIAQLN